MANESGGLASAGIRGLGAFARAVHSIRTRSALVTGTSLLLFLAVFYVAGRCVLSNLIEDTESQVREVGQRMAVLIRREACEMRERSLKVLERPGAGEASAGDLLDGFGERFSFVARFGADGRFVEGVRSSAADGSRVSFPADAFSAYEDVLGAWMRAVRSGGAARGGEGEEAVGIMHLGTLLHGVSLVPHRDGYLLFGLPFSPRVISGRDRECAFANLHVSVVGAEESCRHRPAGRGVSRSDARSRYGISPLFTEAIADVASGLSFWNFRQNPLDAVFVLRDISGNAVSVVSISLPEVFLGATRMAVWQLAFFVALGGIIFVLPIFWVQGWLLLNPLTRMTRAIADLGERATGVDCPRISWEGKDEFALLAESVNRMVETIAAKTVMLANVESRHQALIDGVPDALFICDTHGRLVSMTKQPEGFAPVPGVVPGEPPSAEVFGRESAEVFVHAAEEASRTGSLGVVRLHSAAEMADGARHFEVRLARMGQRYVLAIVRDVTREIAEHERRVAAEERALDTSKRESLTNFAAGIAHDMNNVLAVVQGTVDAAEADENDDKAAAVRTIRDAVRRGSSMMRELTAFAGENRMTLMRTAPQVILDDVRQIASRTVGENIDLTFESSPGLPDVDVDLNQFWKVIFNIVKNAGEAIGKNPGHISLRAVPFMMTPAMAMSFLSESPLPEGKGALFEVIDDGPGIPRDVLRRIFDPYVSSKGLGRGLGLATVRTIVEAHGGGIEVLSHHDCGTIFRVYLPASKMPVPAETAPERPKSAELSGDVLVVDDDEAILKTTQILCRAMKLSPHVARDRREALAVIRRRSTDLRAIILDAHLGEIDTVRLLGAFRIGAPQTPIILASGSAAADMEKMFRAHPYDVFLQKPYTLDELKRALLSVRRA